MRRQVGAGSGQRYATPSPVAAVAAPQTPTRVPTPPSVIRFRLATLFAAQLFDFGTFTIMVGHHGIEAEANPLIAQGFMSFGMPILAAGKIAQVVLVGSILVILGRVIATGTRTHRIATSVALLAVGGGLLGGVSNVLVH